MDASILEVLMECIPSCSIDIRSCIFQLCRTPNFYSMIIHDRIPFNILDMVFEINLYIIFHKEIDRKYSKEIAFCF